MPASCKEGLGRLVQAEAQKARKHQWHTAKKEWGTWQPMKDIFFQRVKSARTETFQTSLKLHPRGRSYGVLRQLAGCIQTTPVPQQQVDFGSAEVCVESSHNISWSHSTCLITGWESRNLAVATVLK